MKNREPYKQAVDLANSLKRDGLIREYAIGGAVAALLYTEPAYTRDLDIFFIPQQAGGILDMSDLFEYAQKKGHQVREDLILAEGTPVQFLSGGALVNEAIENAVTVDVGGESARIFSPEYVVAVALQAGRHKDIDRVQKVWSQAKELINVTKLKDVLHRYGLSEKFRAATGELP